MTLLGNNHVESVHFVKINPIAVVQANSIWRSRQRFQRQWLVELGCQSVKSWISQVSTSPRIPGSPRNLRIPQSPLFKSSSPVPWKWTWRYNLYHINHKMEVMEVTWLHFLSPVMNEINTLVLKQKIQALLSKQRLYRKSFERNRKKTWLYKNFDMKNII